MELLFSTCYIQVISTRQFLRQMSSSFSYICIYYGTRYALIYITNYASSVRMTIFLLMTHVCHVVYCNMLLCIVCYCMYVIFEGIHVVIVTVFNYGPNQLACAISL